MLRCLSQNFVMSRQTAQINIADVKSGKTEANSKTMAAKVDELPTESGLSLKSNLSDVSIFSYAGVCAVLLRRYFEDQWHREFKLKTLRQVEEHLGLPLQVQESMVALLNGDGVEDVDPYVDALLDDPFLDKSGIAVVFDLLTLALKDGQYDARMRVLIKRMAFYLRVKQEIVEKLELSVVENLSTNQYTMSEEEQKEKANQARKQKAKRIALIGLATIGGGTLIGLTGGLAAPLVAAGAGAIIGGAGAAALGSAAGVAIIGSLFGVAGAGLTGYKMKKRVGAVKEFEFEPLVHGTRLHADNSSTRQLHITIAVTGWLTKEVGDVKKPWSCLADAKEQYCLRWETEHLIAFGQAFDYILNVAMSMAAQEALKYTVLSTIMSAIMWPATLVSASSVIDNPWSVCVQRSVAVGKQLAEVLLAREQGHRPVTLIGYSLGARVIFYCLEELSKRKGCEGIIEDAILLGAPVTGSAKSWAPFERVVAGKIVNGYCRGDWLLKFLYRTSSVQMNIAGLQSVRWENRRMCNIDLSDVVSGHMDYMVKLEEILNVIGIGTVSGEKQPGECLSAQSLADMGAGNVGCLSGRTSRSMSSMQDDAKLLLQANRNDKGSAGVGSRTPVTAHPDRVRHENTNDSGRVYPGNAATPEKRGVTADEEGAAGASSSSASQTTDASEVSLEDLTLENKNDSVRKAPNGDGPVPSDTQDTWFDTKNKNP